MQRVNVFTAPTVDDPDDPPGYHAPRAKLGPMIGASMLGGSIYELQPGQSVCPYHYEFGNASEAPVRVLLLSTMIDPSASVYPDSDKIGVWPGGGHDGLIVRRESAVDYYDGEL